MNLQYLNSTPVTVTADVPKMKLSADVMVPPKFREEINAWMRDFFGVTNTVGDGQTLMVKGTLYMNPRTWERINKEFEGAQR